MAAITNMDLIIISRRGILGEGPTHVNRRRQMENAVKCYTRMEILKAAILVEAIHNYNRRCLDISGRVGGGGGRF